MDKDIKTYNSTSYQQPDSLENSYYSVKIKRPNTKNPDNTTFYRTKSRMTTNKIMKQNFSVPGAAYNSYITDEPQNYSEQNILVVDHLSDSGSLPALYSKNKSILDIFKSKNKLEPHKRMMKNLQLKMNTNPYSFDEINLNKGHRRATTEDDRSMSRIDDHFILNDRNEEVPKPSPKSSLRQYKQTIKSKNVQKNTESTASVDNTHLKVHCKISEEKMRIPNLISNGLKRINAQKSQNYTIRNPHKLGVQNKSATKK